MNLLGWILFGFVVGLIARVIMPAKDPLGMIGTIVIGILGALLGGWVGQALGWYEADDTGGFICATAGAIIILGIYYAVSPGYKRKTNQTVRKGSNRPAA
jgi:uncharacterized membrane protein YeaQ/YmgE (transglycosylase-associated protein family)